MSPAFTNDQFNGQTFDGAFLDGGVGSVIYGPTVAGDQVIDGGYITQTWPNNGVYGGLVYSVVVPTKQYIDGGYIEQPDVFYGGVIYIIPARAFRRIQLEGGGRKLLRATLGDDPVERFFQLVKNGRPFPLYNVSNPIFSWRSPSGQTGTAVARIVDPGNGLIGVRLFTPTEFGNWFVQMKFVDEINFDGLTQGPDFTPPYAPAPGAGEFWEQLPEPLVCRVGSAGGWS